MTFYLYLLLGAAVAVVSIPLSGRKKDFLSSTFNNYSSLNDKDTAEAARMRFHKVVGGPETLSAHKDIRHFLSKDKSRLLNLITESVVKSVLLTEISDRLNGTVLDRPSIIDINEPISEFLYEGDVLVTPEQLSAMEAEDHSDYIRAKRGAPITIATRWPKNRPIGYIFSSEIVEETRRLIRATTAIIGSKTCLSFKENTQVGTQLQFFGGGGCWSYIGMRIEMAFQPISIDVPAGCGIIPIIGHEILHALGIDHTQKRFNRDQFVSVNFAAINADKMINFEKRPESQNYNYGVPYEYGSVMHYDALGFSNNGQATLVPSQADYIKTMGQQRYLTFNDFKMVNLMYNCSENCPVQIYCLNGGYPSPKNCNECSCSDFYAGTVCSFPKKLTTLNVSSTYTTVFHQDFNYANFHSGNEYNFAMFGVNLPEIIKNTVKLHAPEGRKIRVTIKQLAAGADLPCYLSCPFNGVEIVDNIDADLTTMGKIYCCTKEVGVSFISKTNVIGYKAYASPGMPMDATVTYSVV